MKKIFFLITLLAAGCTTGVPMYKNQKGPKAALLDAQFPNAFALLGSKVAAVHFVEVDGVQVGKNAIGGVTRKVHVAPGLTQITVGFISGAMELTRGQFTIDLDVKPAAHYVFTAKVVGIDYDLYIWDASEGENQKTLVKKARTEIRTRDRLHIMPISSSGS